MDYLLFDTMKAIQQKEAANLSPLVIEELKKFPEACRLQVFQSGSDEVAAFMVRRYQNDLELLLHKNEFSDSNFKQQLQEALHWLYTTYPDYCDNTHSAPDFFIQRIIDEVNKRNNSDAVDLTNREAVHEQLTFLKNQSPSLQHLLSYRQKGIVEESVMTEQRPEKLEVGLTVAQLGVLIYLLYEQGLFSASTKIAVIKFFASHLATGKQSNISYESLYGKFFKMELNDLELMKEKLIQMINSINKKIVSN
jgi:hypothetical protein